MNIAPLFYLAGGLVITLVLYIVFSHKRKKTPEDSKEKILEDERRYVEEIIDGDIVSKYTQQEKNNSIHYFEKWQKAFREIIELASEKELTLRSKLVKENEPVTYMPPVVYQKPTAAICFQNVFTQPFYPSPDMCDHMLAARVVDIFVFHNIALEDAKWYRIHKKYHYINHDMSKAIIQFDLYRN